MRFPVTLGEACRGEAGAVRVAWAGGRLGWREQRRHRRTELGRKISRYTIGHTARHNARHEVVENIPACAAKTLGRSVVQAKHGVPPPS